MAILTIDSESRLSASDLQFALQDAEFNAIAVATTGAQGRADRLERFSALKTIHGNAAVAMVVLGVCILIRRIKDIRGKRLSPWARDPKKGPLIGDSRRAILLILPFLTLSWLLWHEHRKLVIKEQIWRELMLEVTLPASFSAGVPHVRFVPVLEQLQNSPHKEAAERVMKFLNEFRTTSALDAESTAGKK